ncbi:MAG: hypothetical protein ACI91Z_000022 [Yoonia sp.]|jgi:hypothetical protein
MSEEWLSKTAKDLARQDLHTIVCLGRVGRGLIDTLPSKTATRIVILEPDPKIAAQLEVGARAGVEVWPLAFAAADGDSILHESSLSTFSSLRLPTGLKTLFPSLREAGQSQVTTCSAQTVIDRLGLKKGAKNALILGAAGEESSAITQLIAMGALADFEYIITTLPREKMFENAADGETLATALAEQAFLAVTTDASDPDLPFVLLKRDPVWAAMLADKTEAARTIEGLEQERDTFQQERAHFTQTLQSERERLTSEVETGNRKLQTLQNEKDALSQTLTQAQDHIQALEHTQTQNQPRDPAKLNAEISRLDNQLNALQTLLVLELTS